MLSVIVKVHHDWTVRSNAQFKFSNLDHTYLMVLLSKPYTVKSILIVKLREREGQGVDPGRSLKGHLLMVDGGWWISFPGKISSRGAGNVTMAIYISGITQHIQHYKH